MSFFGKRAFLLVLLCLVSTGSLAEVALAPKQLLIVKPGVDRLHGSWVAAVINKGVSPESFRVPVLLPSEALDFQPVEGLVPTDVKIESDGVWVEKMFQPGVNVISFAFVTQSKQGMVELNFSAKHDLGELSVMTPHGMLTIYGQDLVSGGSDVQGLQMYDIFISKRFLSRGDEIKVSISGVPQGRQRLWLIGACFAVILLCGSLLLSWRAQRASKQVYGSDIVEPSV